MEIKLPNTLPEGYQFFVLQDQARIDKALDKFGWTTLNNQSVLEFKKHIKKKHLEQRGAVWSCAVSC
jgi:hypothetical protein